MAYAIGVFDYVPGKTRAFVSSLKLGHEVISVRDLIRKRVETEAAMIMEKIHDALVVPDWAETLLNGHNPKPPKPVDVAAQTQRALDAFAQNAFLLIINGRQVESLDDEVRISENSTATFIRLVPLVGG